jgi:hypothetical protein
LINSVVAKVICTIIKTDFNLKFKTYYKGFRSMGLQVREKHITRNNDLGAAKEDQW